MRIISVGLTHETNTFAKIKTTIEDFVTYSGGDDTFSMQQALTRYAGTETIMGGYLAGAAGCGVLLEPMFQASAASGGIVEQDAYETMKDDGTLPIIGVNTYIADNIAEQMNKEIDLTRATYDEKMDQINRLNDFKNKNRDKSAEALERLKKVSLEDGNVFEELLTTVNHCSLGEIIGVLYEVGGKYRRNM